MRAMFDANVLLSYLTSVGNQSKTVVRIVDASFAGRFTLVLPAEVLEEISETLTKKRFFRERITPEEFTNFSENLAIVAELLEPLSIDLEPIVRDRNDDFLIAAGHLHEVDVLVSGDKDLLVLRDKVTAFRILSPREFLTLIEG